MKVSLNRRKVAVIGGGITGLTAAYYMQRMAKQNNIPIDVILIESSLRLGGKIQTLRKDGFIIERGPESFIDFSDSVRDLARDLGIEDKLVSTNEGKTYVALGSELYPIPSQFIYGGPIEVSAFITSGLFSLSGKIRAAGDLILPRSEDKDEPIGDFFRRRFGKEVVENLVEPLLAGTFAGDIDHLSIQAMFPQFYEIEKQHRSLLLGMKKTAHSNVSKMAKSYQTFQNGLSTLIETLEDSLQDIQILKGVKVEKIEKLENNKLNVYLNNIVPIKCDSVILTTPFNVAKDILNDVDLFDEIPNMNYASIATVSMAFNKEENFRNQDAMTFFVSRNSDYAITTGTWCNHKWNNVAPEGTDLFRAYIGRIGDEAIVDLSDNDIEKTVVNDLRKSIGMSQTPLFTVVTRWKQAMPQYTVGHELRIEKMKEKLAKELPQVKLVGSSYEGISVPACISQGKKVALEMIESLLKSQLI
nr:protoporphyrinogen oxidase [Lysinibacillus timonensis]